MDKTQELQDACGSWSDATFGVSENSFSTLWHLLSEVKELIEEVERVEVLTKVGKIDKQDINAFHDEWADVWTLVLDAARKDGISVEELNRFGFRKLRINKNRSWHAPDENGVCRRIKEDE